jgi:hypothetical protein
MVTKFFGRDADTDAGGDASQIPSAETSSDESGPISSGDAMFALSELFENAFEFIESSPDAQIELADINVDQGIPIQVNVLFDFDAIIEQAAPPSDDANDLVLANADNFDLM